MASRSDVAFYRWAARRLRYGESYARFSSHSALAITAPLELFCQPQVNRSKAGIFDAGARCAAARPTGRGKLYSTSRALQSSWARFRNYPRVYRDATDRFSATD